MIEIQRLDELIAKYNDELPQAGNGSNEWYWLIGAITTLEKLKREAIATPAKK